MSNLKKKLPKWAAVLLGKNKGYKGGGGGVGAGSKASTELVTLDSEITREQQKSFSSAWKPVWYTGWHTGVLACATSVVVVLLINIGLTIYAATNPKYKMEGGIGTLYSGSCDKSKTIGLWLHLGINALSTLLLSGSNYTQQCLAAPTRSEIDAAHERRRWMDIGVPSIRNLFRIKLERTLLWAAIGITSIPLHLLYNSAVYNSLAANEILITFVTSNHFEPGAYSNTTGEDSALRYFSHNQTTGKEYGDLGYQTDIQDIQLFGRMLKGYNPDARSYEDLAPSQCTTFYNADFLLNRRNLFLITNYTFDDPYNNTFLYMAFTQGAVLQSSWMCRFSKGIPSRCKSNEVTSRVESGLPWLVDVGVGEIVEVKRCKSERVAGRCKVQFSLGIMIAVICCNLVKACCMVMAVVRSREPTLVTLGDAVDSFLRIPDQTTMGICFADRRFIEKEWMRGSRARPRQWKQKGVQRWWSSVSKTRWITCNFFCLIAIIVTGVLLGSGIVQDRKYMSTDIKSLWTRGFGNVNGVSVVSIYFRNITQAILLANLPQTILSFLYLTYNSLFTCMLAGHEWSFFSREHRALRVTSPRPGQRSTYWLQIPYTYAIPLMTLSALLHWLASQSMFLAKVEMYDPFGRPKPARTSITTVGYSCIAVIFGLTLGILALLAAAAMGHKKFAAETAIVGNCSAAISAACHALEAEPEGIISKKVRWGDVEIVPNLRVRHLTFSSEEAVRKPVFGEVYAGVA
ncbi:hypothetical protein B9Z19DRAFT_1194719 [Tuber borchii]|uniref:DUF6536 domain-containing protein n=1 Tax=Tuber borchii TaxID=42251 RepID=A0A2T6ZM01_TUBBO|nr:hypothetical protein B9Z19DRAFT_1194719 [Tuber borchii]